MPNVPQAERPVAEPTVRPVKPDQEFWKPILSNRQPPLPEAKQCPACEKDFVAGANFCHACGATRRVRSRETDYLDPKPSRTALKTLASALFAVGLAFAFIAAALAWIYAPSGYEGWQALQSWRIQWLLASAVAFLASLCLKTEPPSRL